MEYIYLAYIMVKTRNNELKGVFSQNYNKSYFPLLTAKSCKNEIMVDIKF